MINKEYQKTVNFLEALKAFSEKNIEAREKYGRNFYLKRIEYFLDILGNPQLGFDFVHITGTSGKGSVSIILNSVLNETGIKTGVFCSPFLTTTIERIKVGDKFIPVEEFIEITHFLKPYIKKCKEESLFGAPSYFETILAMAFLYFKKEKCKYVILEAGVGGSFDATNVIKNTKICAITNVGIDHAKLLGDTKKKIAINKSGIIKKDAFFVTTEKDEKLVDVFKKVCLKEKAKYKKLDLDYKVIKNEINNLEFKYKKELYKSKLTGEHQIKNLILVIAICEILKIKKEIIKKVFSKIVLSGRLELMQENPRVILDTAHNSDKIFSTVNFLKRIKYKKLYLLITVAKNKDLKKMFKKIIPQADKVYLTSFSSTHRKSINLEFLKKEAQNFRKERLEVFSDSKKALKEILNRAGNDDLVLITGSSYLAGKLRKHWYSEKFVLQNRKMF